ncbi:MULTISPECIES: hypothetical protein [unclassified Janthinobacterium]|uniref:hypothetical protein n=1 Tax=unclassified Janthinobacterium TaxID=2610881 RepID=UPI0008873547|nr:MULTISPECIES: hypothetical protein [unclassified Janthinobacterium]SDG94172.1 hypothetical protein SAMN05428968_1716 [Janthinobacterium sp. YR213]
MEDKKIVEQITEALLSLEERGELVLTTTFPERAAELLFNTAIKAWLEEALKADEPIECTIPHLLKLTAGEIAARFGVEQHHAREIAYSYYKEWLKTRTMAEVAEIYWHETPFEIAGRAYYHIELGNPDNRDLDYLEWRKRRHAA